MAVSISRIINPDYEICPCRHIKTREVINIIKRKDITSLKGLQRAMRIGDKCGGCRNELAALIDYILDEELIMMDLLFDD